MRRIGFAAELEAVAVEVQFVVTAFGFGRSADSAAECQKPVGEFAAGIGRPSAVVQVVRRTMNWLQ